MRRARIPILALGLFSTIVVPAAADDDSWRYLRAARDSLAAASPLTADFVQSFTPSGFTMADEESGRLALKIAPADGEEDCVRWDYQDPFPKGFLLCGHVAWTWNPGEASGRRQLVGRSESFGLDLLRLSVDELHSSYEATVGARSAEAVTIELTPIGATAEEIRDAALEIDLSESRLVGLSYHDLEGNLTRFSLGDFRPADDPTALFAPPPDLSWLDE